MNCGTSERSRVAVVVLALFAASSSARAIGVLAQPINFYLTGDAGSTLAARVWLSPTAGDAVASLSVTSFTVDQQGKPASCEGRLDRSVVPWTSLSTHRLLLRSGGSEPLDLKLEIPLAAVGTYWGAVMMDVEPAAPDHLLPVRSRLAIPLFVTVRGTEAARVRIEELHAFRSAEGDVLVNAMIVNDGNTVLHSPVLLSVEAGDRSAPIELASLEDTVVTVLPGNRRAIRLLIRGDFGADRKLRVGAWIRFGRSASEVVEGLCDVLPTRCATPGCVGS